MTSQFGRQLMRQNKEQRQLAALLGFVAQQNFHLKHRQKVATLGFLLQQLPREDF
jgi:hypothetical protein